MKNLKISKDISIPPEIVTQKLAWLGTTGSGKTYGASKLAEQMWNLGAQFVVLDPVGVWYGLRLAKDGKKPSSIDIPIFGGLHGDVPLEPTAGELLANLVVDKNLSCIIDVSQFESDADKTRFATAFADRFFFRKKSMPSAVHIFIEECQEFVPQNPQKGEERMLHAFIRMQKLGRNFGIGSSYITQRPQEVNKKALNMAQTLFVFRNTGTHERQAIEKWIEDKSLDETIANDLPKIPTGHCHIWSPEFLKISEIIHISEKETFNASATPEVGSVAKSRQLAPIDLEKVRADMLATIEKAKADDPKLLKKKIFELEKQLTTQLSTIGKAIVNKDIPMGVSQWMKYGEKYGYDKFFEKKILNETQRKYQSEIKARESTILDLQKIFSHIKKMIPIFAETDPAFPGFKLAFKKPTSNMESFDKPVGIDPRTGALKILSAIAQYPEGISMSHISILTQYKSTSRTVYTQELVKAGYIRKQGDVYFPTDSGIEYLGDEYQELPRGKELHKHLMNTLPDGEKRLFAVIIGAYPNTVNKQELMDSTGYKATSTSVYIQHLLARKVIEKTSEGYKAEDKLFTE